MGEGRLKNNRLDRDLIFFSPGVTGGVFGCKAGSYISTQIIKAMQERLQEETGKKVIFSLERRIEPRDK